jgi:hypothetical protein
MFGTNGELFTTASSAIGGGGTIDTGSLVTTASFNAYTGSNTSQFAGTASHSITSNTSITSQTSSHATNFTIESKLSIDSTLTDYATVLSTIVGANNLFTQATGSYTSAHGKYTIYKGANARAGEFVTSWNSNTVEYHDISTNDIGNTEDVTFESSIVTSDIQINATAISSGWTVKMLITYI